LLDDLGVVEQPPGTLALGRHDQIPGVLQHLVRPPELDLEAFAELARLELGARRRDRDRDPAGDGEESQAERQEAGTTR
jgi:hypothetical protein